MVILELTRSFGVSIPEAGANMSQTIHDSLARVPNIMVVEDELLVRMAVAESFELAGFNVLEAGNGEEAVNLLSQGGPLIDLVFTDVRMPGSVDGFALSAWIKQHCPAIPVFIASGDLGLARSRNELAPGQAFFSKPYSLDAVISRIKLELRSVVETAASAS